MNHEDMLRQMARGRYPRARARIAAQCLACGDPVEPGDEVVRIVGAWVHDTKFCVERAEGDELVPPSRAEE